MLVYLDWGGGTKIKEQYVQVFVVPLPLVTAPSAVPQRDAETRLLRNAGVERDRRWPVSDAARVGGFHRSLPGYGVTPLRELDLAGAVTEPIGVLVKDESERLGLPAFKVLGASWAVVRTLAELAGVEPEAACCGAPGEWFHALGPRTLIAATDGNHGMAVAHMARLLGLGCEIYVPAAASRDRIAAIEARGAVVHVVHGTYDDAVERCAADASETRILVSDTAWPGYERIPSWVIDGYATLFCEVDAQLAGSEQPSVVFVQVGVGALAAAAVAHYRAAGRAGAPPLIVGVEPLDADCARRTADAGEAREAPGPHRSAMSCLNAGVCSHVALPALLHGIDAYVAIGDRHALRAMELLREGGIDAGATGAAGLAGLLALSELDAGRALLAERAPGPVLVLNTEAAQEHVVTRGMAMADGTTNEVSR